MPCFSGFITNNKQLLVNVNIGSTTKERSTSTKGLLDTGANQTCISKDIIDTLKLVSEEKKKISTPTDTVLVNQYNINLILAISDIKIHKNRMIEEPKGFFLKKDLEVSELINTPIGYNMLIGMDVLMDFSIYIFRGQFTLCF